MYNSKNNLVLWILIFPYVIYKHVIMQCAFATQNYAFQLDINIDLYQDYYS